jgi:hypothetical protein
MPIVNGQYQAPTWVNGQRPPINAEELQAICDVLEASQGGSVINFNEFYNNPAPAPITLTPLATRRYSFNVTNAGDYFIVGGGNSSLTTVEAYDSNLTKVTNPDPFTTGRFGYGAAYAGNYAIFAGGNISNGTTNTLEIYDETLTKVSTSVDSLQSSRQYLSAVSFNGYAIFGGGNTSSAQTDVDCYSSSLVHQTLTDTISYGYQASSGTVGSYAMFGPGDGGSNLQSVTVYNDSLQRITADNFISPKYGGYAVNSGNYIIFGPGGYTSGISSSIYNGYVDFYDNSLVHTTSTYPYTATRYSYGATTTDYGVLGCQNSSTPIAVSYDSNLSTNQITPLEITGAVSTAINGYGVVLYNGSGTGYGTVSAYTNNTSYYITIPRFSAYLLDGINESETYTAVDVDISGQGTLTGYIKRGGFNLSGYHPEFVI